MRKKIIQHQRPVVTSPQKNVEDEKQMGCSRYTWHLNKGVDTYVQDPLEDYCHEKIGAHQIPANGSRSSTLLDCFWSPLPRALQIATEAWSYPNLTQHHRPPILQSLVEARWVFALRESTVQDNIMTRGEIMRMAVTVSLWLVRDIFFFFFSCHTI